MRYDMGMSNYRFIPKNPRQAEFLEVIKTHDLVFCNGPPGTGKTYAAAIEAANALEAGEVSRIILARSATTTESIGFIPGSEQDKISPFMWPFYDAWADFWTPGKVDKLLESGHIEPWSISYMQGRTMRGAFVLVDEYQNLTLQNLMLVLTRLHYDSKMVCTGDWTQSLTKHNGLKLVDELIYSEPRVGCVQYLPEDCTRHPLVANIYNAYKRIEDKL